MCRAMRHRGGTLRLYQLSPSTESTQKSCTSPLSILYPIEPTSPRSSHSKNRPQDEGKAIAGTPAWPKTSSSMSRPSREENHLWYSRFIDCLSPGTVQESEHRQAQPNRRPRMAQNCPQ